MSSANLKCTSCVDGYGDVCHNPKSEFYGAEIGYAPWDGCRCYLSIRKWGVADRSGKTKKRRKKWPSMEEFEFGVSI